MHGLQLEFKIPVVLGKLAGQNDPGNEQQQRRSAPRSDERRSGEVAGPSGNASFEDKLKQFMQESDSRIADNKMYADHRSSRRRK